MGQPDRKVEAEHPTLHCNQFYSCKFFDFHQIFQDLSNDKHTNKDVGPSSVQMPESATVPSAPEGTGLKTQSKDITAMAGASILASLSNQLDKEDDSSNDRTCNKNDGGGGGGEKNQEGIGEEDVHERNNVISSNSSDSTEAVINTYAHKTTGTKDGLSRPDPLRDQTGGHIEFRYCGF